MAQNRCINLYAGVRVKSAHKDTQKAKKIWISDFHLAHASLVEDAWSAQMSKEPNNSFHFCLFYSSWVAVVRFVDPIILYLFILYFVFKLWCSGHTLHCKVGGPH